MASPIVPNVAPIRPPLQEDEFDQASLYSAYTDTLVRTRYLSPGRLLNLNYSTFDSELPARLDLSPLKQQYYKLTSTLTNTLERSLVSQETTTENGEQVDLTGRAAGVEDDWMGCGGRIKSKRLQKRRVSLPTARSMDSLDDCIGDDAFYDGQLTYCFVNIAILNRSFLCIVRRYALYSIYYIYCRLYIVTTFIVYH